jgi:hypothetical protein
MCYDTNPNHAVVKPDLNACLGNIQRKAAFVLSLTYCGWLFGLIH